MLVAALVRVVTAKPPMCLPMREGTDKHGAWLRRNSAEEECNSDKHYSMDKPQKQAQKMSALLTRLLLDVGFGQANSEGAGGWKL